MAMSWCRLYNEFATDPKVQSMSESMQRRLVMLFCLKSGNVLETLRERDIAFALRISDAELAETKALFLDKNFIDKDWNILHWEKRQFLSDSSTTRTRKWREKQRNTNPTVTGTSQERHCDGLDTDTDSEETHIQKEKKESGEVFLAPIPETPKLPESSISGVGRIEKARALWNSHAPAIGPACRLLAIQFRPDDTSDCLRTMSGYTNEEIAEAMGNYEKILASSEHEIKSRYQSFIGFIRGGVEKFVSSAKPFEAFKRKTPTWEKQDRGALDDRPDATTPEAIAEDNARAAEEAMSPEDFEDGLQKIKEKIHAV